MATVTFLDPGTEATQDLTFYPNVFTGGAGTAASATDQFHSGTRSLKCVNSVKDDTAGACTGDGVCADAGTRITFWVRLSSVGLGFKTALFFVFQTGFNNATWVLGINTNNTLNLGSEGPGSLGNGTATLSANTWTRIAFSYAITSGTNWAAKVYVNGVLDINLTNTAGTLTNTGTGDLAPGIGPDSTAGYVDSAILTAWYDDLYVDNGTDLADPGAILVTSKRPFANGTTNGFTAQIGAGGSGYGSGHAPQVNERPLSQTNGWSILVAGSAVTEEYTVEGSTVGDVNLAGATIKGVMGWIFAKSSLTETDKILVDGTQTSITVTSTPSLFTQVSPNPTTYPAGTGSDIGMVTNTTVATASFYECGILIAYLAAIGPQPDTYQPPIAGLDVSRLGPPRWQASLARISQSLNFNPARDLSTALPQPDTYQPPIAGVDISRQWQQRQALTQNRFAQSLDWHYLHDTSGPLGPQPDTYQPPVALALSLRQSQAQVAQTTHRLLPVLWFVSVDPTTSIVVPDTYQPPILGPTALTQQGVQLHQQAIKASLLSWSLPQNTSAAQPTQAPAVAPIAGVGAYRDALSGMAGAAIVANFMNWGGGGDLSFIQPDTYVPPVLGTQNLGALLRQQAATVALLNELLLWTPPQDVSAVQVIPDTYPQPVAGLGAVPQSLAGLASRARLLATLGWHRPQDVSVTATQPDTFIQTVQGPAQFAAGVQQQRARAVAAEALGWHTAKDTSIGAAQPDTYQPPVAGLYSVRQMQAMQALVSRIGARLAWTQPEDLSVVFPQVAPFVPPIAGVGIYAQSVTQYRTRASLAQFFLWQNAHLPALTFVPAWAQQSNRIMGYGGFQPE